MRQVIAIAVLGVLVFVGCSKSYEPAAREASSTTPSPSVTVEPPAGSGTTTPASTAGESSEIVVGQLQLLAPDSWIRQQPRSQFVQAEFALVKAGGDEVDGRLTVSLAGGSIDANLQRWRGQFKDLSDEKEPEQLQVDGLEITLVDLTGTYNDQPGPFAPGVERKGYRLLAAVVPVGDQLHFIKAYGPQATMAAHANAFRAFLESAKLQ